MMPQAADIQNVAKAGRAVQPMRRRPPTFTLWPSDLAYVWEDCRRCFYLQVARGVRRPRTPFPAIFIQIDRIMRCYFAGRDIVRIVEGMPPGTIDCREQAVRSTPIGLPGYAARCVISGRYDSVVRFADGSYGLIDFKTRDPRTAGAGLLWRQLHAYAYALEHPAPGRPLLAPITRLGLLRVGPTAMGRIRGSPRRYALCSDTVWIECPRDERAFIAFLRQVLDVLSRPDLPPAAPSCQFCRYRVLARRLPA
jgi:hypothetical protein